MTNWKKAKQIIFIASQKERIRQQRWERLKSRNYLSQESLTNWLQLAKELGEQNNETISNVLFNQSSRLKEVEKLKEEVKKIIEREREEKIYNLPERKVLENNIVSLAKQIFEQDVEINEHLHQNQFIINELEDLQRKKFFEDIYCVADAQLDKSVTDELEETIRSWEEEINNLKKILSSPISNYLNIVNDDNDLKKKLWQVLDTGNRQSLMELKHQVEHLQGDFKKKEKEQEIIKIKNRIESRMEIGALLSDEEIIRYLKLTLANIPEEETWIGEDWWVRCGLTWKESENFSLKMIEKQCRTSLKYKRKRDEKRRNLEAKIETKH